MGGSAAYTRPSTWPCHKISHSEPKFRRRSIRKANSIAPRLGEGTCGWLGRSEATSQDGGRALVHSALATQHLRRCGSPGRLSRTHHAAAFAEGGSWVSFFF